MNLIVPLEIRPQKEYFSNLKKKKKKKLKLEIKKLKFLNQESLLSQEIYF